MRLIVSKRTLTVSTIAGAVLVVIWAMAACGEGTPGDPLGADPGDASTVLEDTGDDGSDAQTDGEMCILERCAEELSACMADEVCASWIGCVQECGDDTILCPTFCGLYYNTPPAADFTVCAVEQDCLTIDLSGFPICRVPQTDLHGLDDVEGTWWMAASSGEEDLFAPDCQRYELTAKREDAVAIGFTVPLTHNGVDTIARTDGEFVKRPDGSWEAVYDSYAEYHENWYFVHKSPNVLVAHLCFSSEADSRDLGTLLLSRVPLQELAAEERDLVNANLSSVFDGAIDDLKAAVVEGCENEE